MNSTEETEILGGLGDFEKINVPYAVSEIFVAIIAVIGNAMVIIVFKTERRLRRRTNYYIVSLAVADFLVGLLGVPFAIMASVGLPYNLHACLFTVSLLVVLCTISIFCLVAVSVDRYWAILHPMGYSRNVRTKTALVIISICWISGSVVGFLPLFGWHAGDPTAHEQKCYFVQVMDYDYLVFLYFATIVTPAIILAAFYAHIYRVVIKQVYLRQIVAMGPKGTKNGQIRVHGGTMLRMLGAAQKREVKATQNLSIIVLFFMICWLPLYTINCVQAFCHTCEIPLPLTNFSIILSHLNSAVNPLLYAYHLRDFRAALKHLICVMFGIKEKEVLPDRNCRPSLNSNCSQYRRPFLRNQPSSESLIFYRKKMGLPIEKKICLPIVGNTTALAVSTVSTPKNLWIIKESSDIERDISVFPDGFPNDFQVNETPSETSSGNLNTGYVDELIEDLQIGEDEVFYADDFESDTSEILRRINFEPSEGQKGAQGPKRNPKIWCLSSSSPQLSRSVFLVENSENFKKERNFSATDQSSPTKTSNKSPKAATIGDFILHHSGSTKKTEDS